VDAQKIFMEEIEKVAISLRSTGIVDPSQRRNLAQGIKSFRNRTAPPEIMKGIPSGKEKDVSKSMVEAVKRRNEPGFNMDKFMKSRHPEIGD